MADNLASLQVQLELQSAQFTAEMQKVIGHLSSLNKSAQSAEQGMGKLGSILKGVFATGVLVAGAKSIIDSVLRVSDSFDEVGKAAQKIGIATEALSGLRFAGEQSGVSFEQLQGGIKKLAVGMAELNDETSKSAIALRSAGVTSADTTAQAFEKVATALAKMPDGYQKTAAAVAIFGKSGSDLIPLLNEGGAGIKKMTDRAEELGLVMKDKTVAQLTLFNDSLAEIGRSADGLKNKIIEGLAPALAGIAQTIADAKKTSDAWVAFGKRLGGILTDFSIAIEVVITDIKILALAVQSLGSLDALKSFSVERQKLIDQSDRYRTTLLENIEAAEELNKVTNTLGTTTSVTTGKFEAGPLEKWAEGIKKAADEVLLLPEKMNILSTAMASLDTSTHAGASTLRVYQEEYAKLNEAMAKDSPFGRLEIEIQKVMKATKETADAIVYLEERMQMTDSIEELLALVEVLDKLKGKTQDVGNDMAKLSENIVDAIGSNASNAVNSFIDSIGTAKLNFGDFAASVLKDIAKMIVQLLIMKPLMDGIKGYFGIGGVSGKAFGDTMMGGTSLPQGIYHQPTFFKFANGGVPGSRTGVLAEAGRSEAIVPLIRHGKDLGVGASPVNLNIYNNAGVEVQTQSSEGSDGSKQIDVYIEKKVREMVSGGGLDRSMRGAYGLTRVGA